MAKFRKRPVVIEAEQFTFENKDRVLNWVTCNTTAVFDEDGNPVLKIQTLEGFDTAYLNYYVTRSATGEFRTWPPDIFAATYEPAD